MKELEAGDNTKFKDGVNRNARLIVRNISFKATEDDLRKHFCEYGTVEEVKLLRKPDGRLVGCGFVHYTHVPMANKALVATNKKPFLDRPLNVAWAVPKHKYGENGEQTTPNNKFENDTNTDVKSDRQDEENNVKSNRQKDKVRINRNARLVVRNVSFKATEESLKEHFQPYGDILEVKLLKKPDGKLVGCAFVHFKNVPMAKKALLSTNMKPFLGRPISVDWAVAKNKYMQHIVNQQLEMQDDVKMEDDSDDDDKSHVNKKLDTQDNVKVEDSDSDDDGSKDLKQEETSESEDDSGEDSEEVDVKEENDSEDSESDKEDDDEKEDDDDEVDDEGDNQSQTSTQPEWKRTKLNDAEDGCTVFVTNVPFSVDDHQLRQFAEQTAPVKYALVCVDKMTEHSKGSGFIKFTNAEDAEKFLALPANQLQLEGQVVQVKPALKRESLQKSGAKQPKDNRNLYLVKEGVVVAGTKAAVGVSASDMAKRLALERSKTQMLKNLNRFVSRYRLVVSNLPPSCNDSRLRRVSFEATGRAAAITEARVMRDLRAPLAADGQHPSKGYGFVMFTRHEDALACLRKLNNNPDIFDKNNRPIVSFSIEDRTALNARKKRLEKSIANNPQSKNFDHNNQSKNSFNNNQGKGNFKNQSKYNEQGKNNADNQAYQNRKRMSQAPPDESHVKKRKFDKKGKNMNQNENNTGKFVRRPRDNDIGEYTGLTAKEGAQHKMRSNHKLKAQADIHRQTVKLEKKKSGKAMRLKMAAKERVKQPKQKINKTPGKKNKRKKFKSNDIRDILK